MSNNTQILLNENSDITSINTPLKPVEVKSNVNEITKELEQYISLLDVSITNSSALAPVEETENEVKSEKISEENKIYKTFKLSMYSATFGQVFEEKSKHVYIKLDNENVLENHQEGKTINICGTEFKNCIRGLNIVIVDGRTGAKKLYKVFDTHCKGNYSPDELITVLKNNFNILNHDILTIIVADEAAASLTQEVRNYLKSLGSQEIYSLESHQAWCFVAQGKKVLLEKRCGKPIKEGEIRFLEESVNVDIRLPDQEELLTIFSDAFLSVLKSLYDHLSIEEMMNINEENKEAEKNKIQQDILDKVQNCQDFQSILNCLQEISAGKNISQFQEIQQIFNIYKDKESILLTNFKQSIYSVSTSYFNDLVMLREKIAKTFEAYEKNLCDFLFSYSSVSEEKINKELKNISDRIKEITQQDKKNYDYEKSLQIFKDLSNLLKSSYGNEKTIQFVDSLLALLNNNTLNHRAYLFDYLFSLQSVLQYYPDTYIVEKRKNNDAQIVEVKAHSMSLKQVLGLKDKMGELHPGDEIRLMISNNFYYNCDKGKEFYPGVNWSIIAPNHIVISQNNPVSFDTSGLDGVPHNNPKAEDAITSADGKGVAGKDGVDGKPGMNAGHILLIGNQIPESIKCIAKGGNGGKGQDGGNGSAGKDGVDGKDADADNYSIGSVWSDFHYSVLDVIHGTEGTTGFAGGDAGFGGKGGEAGKSGIIERINLLENKQEKIEDTPGKDGEDGISGKPGMGGYHGKQGRDASIYVEWEWTLGARHKNIKRGYIANRNCRGDSGRWQIISHPYFSHQENDDIFKSKQENRKANQGKQNTCKSTNREYTKINTVTNKQSIFESSQQHIKTCQSNSINALNHSFLKSFAKALSYPECKVGKINLPSEKIKESKAQFLPIFNRQMQAAKENSKKTENNQKSSKVTSSVLQDYNEKTTRKVTSVDLFENNLHRKKEIFEPLNTKNNSNNTIMEFNKHIENSRANCTASNLLKLIQSFVKCINITKTSINELITKEYLDNFIKIYCNSVQKADYHSEVLQSVYYIALALSKETDISDFELIALTAGKILLKKRLGAHSSYLQNIDNVKNISQYENLKDYFIKERLLITDFNTNISFLDPTIKQKIKEFNFNPQKILLERIKEDFDTLVKCQNVKDIVNNINGIITFLDIVKNNANILEFPLIDYSAYTYVSDLLLEYAEKGNNFEKYFEWIECCLLILSDQELAELEFTLTNLQFHFPALNEKVNDIKAKYLARFKSIEIEKNLIQFKENNPEISFKKFLDNSSELIEKCKKLKEKFDDNTSIAGKNEEPSLTKNEGNSLLNSKDKYKLCETKEIEDQNFKSQCKNVIETFISNFEWALTLSGEEWRKVERQFFDLNQLFNIDFTNLKLHRTHFLIVQKINVLEKIGLSSEEDTQLNSIVKENLLNLDLKKSNLSDLIQVYEKIKKLEKPYLFETYWELFKNTTQYQPAYPVDKKLFSLVKKNNQLLNDSDFQELVRFFFDLNNYSIKELSLERLSKFNQFINLAGDDIHDETTKKMQVIVSTLFNKYLLEYLSGTDEEFYEWYNLFLTYCEIENDSEFYNLILSDMLNNYNKKEKKEEVKNKIRERCLEQQRNFSTTFNKIKLNELPGNLLNEKGEHSNEITPFQISNFSKISELVSDLPSEHVDNVLSLLSFFDDLTPTIAILENFSSETYEKQLLVEHFIEKYFESYNGITELDCTILREHLLNCDIRFIKLFHNIFIEEQYNKIKGSTPDNSNTKTTLISNKSLLQITNLLSDIQYTDKIIEELLDKKLDTWVFFLSEISFKQKINSWLNDFELPKLPKEDAEWIIFFLNSIRTRMGENSHDIFSDFSTLIFKLRKNDIPEFKKILRNLYYNKISFENSKSAINSLLYSSVSTQEITPQNTVNTNDRTISEISEIMSERTNDTLTTVSINAIHSIEKIANEVSDVIIKYKEKKPSDDEIAKIKKSIDTFLNSEEYQKDKKNYIENHLSEVVSLACLGWWLATDGKQIPYDTQLFGLISFFKTENNSGLLEQIRTGEGKTLTVGLLALIKALSGEAVDVVTSNYDLAKEGCDKMQPLFKLFKLNSGLNCTQDEDQNHQAYQSNIVYGDIASFEGHILHDEYEQQPIFKDRYLNKTKSLIIDEVDSMFIDNCKNMLYLSHEIDSLKSIEPLFTYIWSAVLGENEENYENIDAAVFTVETAIKNFIKDKNIIVPDYLKEFCDVKLSYWIKSAFQAKHMNHDDHFILDNEKNSNERRIIVIDKKTGLESYSVKWSHGLAQFLELKYRRKLTPESLKAIFMSNKKFFSRYGNNVFGMTGTLGNDYTRKVLSDIYHLQFAQIPSRRQVQFDQCEGRVSCSQENWQQLVLQDVEEKIKKQPILIICDSIAEAQQLETHLKINTKCNITEYYKNEHSLYNSVTNKPKEFSAGDIIISTNKGGRGTDISTKAKDGLHVILGFLPENIRIEDQAMGRASRNGQKGSGRLIIKVDDSYAQEYLDKNEKNEKLVKFSEIIIEKEKHKREREEQENLSQLIEVDLNQLDAQEEVFSVFNEFKLKLFSQSFPINATEKELVDLKKLVLTILNDRFAFWLDKSSTKVEQVNSIDSKNFFIEAFKKEFIQIETEYFDSKNAGEFIKNFFKMPEDYIRLGQTYFKHGNYSKAKEYFEIAIDKGDLTGFAALSSACCTVKVKDGDDNRIKKTVRNKLKLARFQLEKIKTNFMSNKEVVDSLVKITNIKEIVSDKENLYGDQIESKLEVVGTHLHYINKYIGSVIEETSFINVAEKIDEKKSKEIYELLAEKSFIQDGLVVRAWKNKKEKFEHLMQEKIDSSLTTKIKDKLAQAYDNRCRIKPSDLEDIAYGSDELWEILNKLGLISKLEEEINYKENSFFQNREEILKKLTLGNKYDAVVVKTETTKDGALSLKEHLANVFIECKNKNQKLDISLLEKYTFESRKKEAQKIYDFLKGNRILKSGGLAKEAFKSQKDLKNAIGSILPSDKKSNIDFIVNKLAELKGDIRKFENPLQASFKSFYELEEEIVPIELNFFEGLGLDHFLILEEKVSWWNWNIFACAMLGLAQIIAGAAILILTAGTATQVANMLISEGISDMVYATMAGISGHFSWEEWGIQKAISLAISLATYGVGKLASLGKTVSNAAKLGQISRTATFARTVGKAVANAGLQVGVSLTTDRVIELVKNGLIDNILNTFEANILQDLQSSLKYNLERLKAEHPQNFDSALKDILEKARTKIVTDAELSVKANQIVSHTMNALQQGFRKISSNLTKGSGIAKIFGGVAKVVELVSEIFNVIEPIVKASTATQVYVNHINQTIEETLSNKNEIKREACDASQALKGLVAELKQEMSNKISEAIRGPFQTIINSSLKKAQSHLNEARKQVQNNLLGGLSTAEKLHEMKNNHTSNSTKVVKVASPNQAKATRPKRSEEIKNKLKNRIIEPIKRKAQSIKEILSKPIHSIRKYRTFKREEKGYRTDINLNGSSRQHLNALAQLDACQYQLVSINGEAAFSKDGRPHDALFTPKNTAIKPARILQYTPGQGGSMGHCVPCIEIDGKLRAIEIKMDKMSGHNCVQAAAVFHDKYEKYSHIKDPETRIKKALEKTTPKAVNKKIDAMHKTVSENSYLQMMTQMDVGTRDNFRCGFNFHVNIGVKRGRVSTFFHNVAKKIKFVVRKEQHENIEVPKPLSGKKRLAKFSKAQQESTAENRQKPLTTTDVDITMANAIGKADLSKLGAANCHIIADQAIASDPQLAKKMAPHAPENKAAKKASTECQENLRHGNQVVNNRINNHFDPEYDGNGQQTVRTKKMINNKLEAFRRNVNKDAIDSFFSATTPFRIEKSPGGKIRTIANRGTTLGKLDAEFPELKKKQAGLYTATSSSPYKCRGTLFSLPSEQAPQGHLVKATRKRSYSVEYDNFEHDLEVSEKRASVSNRSNSSSSV